MKSWQLVAAVLLSFVSVCSARSTDVNDLHPGAGWGLCAHSENGQFAAILIQPADINDCVLEVYDVNGPENKLLWKANVSSNYPRGGLFLSNDASYVARLNAPKESRGDALEFYVREQGKIKGYSREQLLGFCEALTGKGKWDVLPAFYIFHSLEGLTYFCGSILGREKLHWVCWAAASGEQIEVDERLEAIVCEGLRQRQRKVISDSQRTEDATLACLFLSKLKRSDDRVLLQKLLSDQAFVTTPKWFEAKSLLQRALERINIDTETRYELDYFYGWSLIRQSADRALAQWEGKVVGGHLRWRGYPYHYLGTVRVQVALKAKPKKAVRLWVYLVPASVGRAEWDRERPVHYLIGEFEGLDSEHKIGRTIPCIFGGVTPGRYWVKAVWDKAKPFHRRSDDFCRPQKGDYESVDSPVIEVKAGKVADVGVIECKQKVKGK